jgi:RNA polymerase sigma factor (sigma-70 family)
VVSDGPSERIESSRRESWARAMPPASPSATKRKLRRRFMRGLYPRSLGRDFSRRTANHRVMDARETNFESLLKTHERALAKVAGLYCFHPEERRDLAQEIRVQLWRAFPKYDENRPFATWMYRIALNVAISHARRTSQQKSVHVPLDEAITEVPTPETDPRVAFLERFLESLDEWNRALLILHLEGHSYAEISEVLGITETNVSTKLSRLKQKIRKKNEEDEEIPHGTG